MAFTIFKKILNRNDKSEHITHLDNVVRIIIPWPQCRGAVFVFKKHYATHRFSVGSHPTGRDSFHVAADWLTERGVPFDAAELELEMGQPLRSLGEAQRFFNLYSRDADKSVITDEFLRSKLVETGRPDFPLYLPQRRAIGCLRFSAAGLR